MGRARPGSRREASRLGRGLLLAAAVSILLLVTAASFRRIWEADFWWQYKAGEIVAMHGIPRTDTLCYVSEGRPWIEMRWLYCVLLYRLIQLAGFPAAVVAKWLAVVAAFGFAVAAGAWRRAPVVACAVFPVAILASTQRFFVRPEMASFFFFALFLWVVARYRRNGGWILYVLPVLQILWSNLHTLFLLGPAIVGLLLVVEAARLVPRRARASAEWPDRRRRIVTIAAVLAATTAACLVTPYGTRGVAFGAELLREIHDPVFRQISRELAGPFSFGQHYTAVVYYEALLGICLVSALLNLRRLDPFWTALLLSQLYLSLTSVRNLPLFCLAAIPFVLANASASALWRRGALIRVLPAARFAMLVLSTGLSLGYSVSLVTDRFNVQQGDSNQFGASLARHRFADGATRFLREHPVPGALFNSMFEGAYLLAHDVQVFIDPRLEVHGTAYLGRYLKMMSDDGAWREALAQYDFQTAVVDLLSPFLRHLTEAEGWNLVYFDEVVAVFVRAGTPGAPRPIRSAEEFQSAVARIRTVLPPPRPYPARSLLGRVDSPVPYERLGEFLLQAGRPDLAEPFAREALVAYPLVPGAHGIVGRILAGRGDREGALREYEAELAVSSGNAFARREAGLLHFVAGHTEPALELLRRSVEEVPTDAQVWAVLTKLLADQGRTEEALAAAKRAAELAPTNPEYVKNLGRLEGEAGRLDEGIETLKRGLVLAPDGGTYGDLATFLFRKGRREEALATIERGLALAPGDPELLRIRAALTRGRTASLSVP